MARADGSEAAARRLGLAEAAIRRAHEAAEHGEQLQRLAGRWARHAEVAALHQSLDRVGRVLAELASAEEDIMSRFTKLAADGDPDLAEERRHLANEALAGARYAGDRARAVRRLAETSAAGTQPPEDDLAGERRNRK